MVTTRQYGAAIFSPGLKEVLLIRHEDDGGWYFPFSNTHESDIHVVAAASAVRQLLGIDIGSKISRSHWIEVEFPQTGQPVRLYLALGIQPDSAIPRCGPGATTQWHPLRRILPPVNAIVRTDPAAGGPGSRLDGGEEGAEGDGGGDLTLEAGIAPFVAKMKALLNKHPEWRISHLDPAITRLIQEAITLPPTGAHANPHPQLQQPQSSPLQDTNGPDPNEPPQPQPPQLPGSIPELTPLDEVVTGAGGGAPPGQWNASQRAPEAHAGSHEAGGWSDGRSPGGAAPASTDAGDRLKAEPQDAAEAVHTVKPELRDPGAASGDPAASPAAQAGPVDGGLTAEPNREAAAETEPATEPDAGDPMALSAAPEGADPRAGQPGGEGAGGKVAGEDGGDGEGGEGGAAGGGDVGTWRGPRPQEHLLAYCRVHQFPEPCYSLVVKKSARRPLVTASCLLPHLGVQVTPDMHVPGGIQAACQAAALAAILWLEGALPPDGGEAVRVVPVGWPPLLSEARGDSWEAAQAARRAAARRDLDLAQREALLREMDKKRQRLVAEAAELERLMAALRGGEAVPEPDLSRLTVSLGLGGGGVAGGAGEGEAAAAGGGLAEHVSAHRTPSADGGSASGLTGLAGSVTVGMRALQFGSGPGSLVASGAGAASGGRGAGGDGGRTPGPGRAPGTKRPREDGHAQHAATWPGGGGGPEPSGGSGPVKSVVMELKELCDRRRWPQPQYNYSHLPAATGAPAPGTPSGATAVVTLPSAAGLGEFSSGLQSNRKRAKEAAAAAALAQLSALGLK